MGSRPLELDPFPYKSSFAEIYFEYMPIWKPVSYDDSIMKSSSRAYVNKNYAQPHSHQAIKLNLRVRDV